MHIPNWGSKNSEDPHRGNAGFLIWPLHLSRGSDPDRYRYTHICDVGFQSPARKQGVSLHIFSPPWYTHICDVGFQSPARQQGVSLHFFSPLPATPTSVM